MTASLRHGRAPSTSYRHSDFVPPRRIFDILSSFVIQAAPRRYAMPLIVDCYNLLHTPMPPALAGLDEQRLCELLARGPWRGVVVVCDGQIKPGLPSRSPVEGVELTYSGKGRSADTVIAHLIQRDTAPRRLIVVSSDRQIQKAARRRRAEAWSSDQLISVLARLVASSNRNVALHDERDHGRLDDEQVEYWLRQFGYETDADQIDPDDSAAL